MYQHTKCPEWIKQKNVLPNPDGFLLLYCPRSLHLIIHFLRLSISWNTSYKSHSTRDWDVRGSEVDDSVPPPPGGSCSICRPEILLLPHLSAPPSSLPKPHRSSLLCLHATVALDFVSAPSVAWNLHCHPQPAQNIPIPYANSSLESTQVSPASNDLFPLQLPQNFVCCLIMECTSFCLRFNPLPDFQGLDQWPRLIHFGIFTLPVLHCLVYKLYLLLLLLKLYL